jgi:hypothetical protein
VWGALNEVSFAGMQTDRHGCNEFTAARLPAPMAMMQGAAHSRAPAAIGIFHADFAAR